MLALNFHHLGLAVSAPEAARAFLGALGYTFSPALYDPLQGVHLAMCHHASMPDIEMIWAQGNKPSPLNNMLKKRDGLIYHICYSADNVEKALADIEALGLQLLPVAEAKPAVLFNGLFVSFYYVHGVGLIEIIHNQ